MSSVADIVELKEERSRRVPLTDSEFSNAGAMLKAAREAAGHTIDDVHEATNVRADYLEAIENMETDRLPLPAYTSGFVKAYAQFLELPYEPMVARFRSEAGYERKSTIAPELPAAPRNDLAGGRELSLIAVVAILFFVIWVAFQITRPAEDTGPIRVEGTPIQPVPIETAEPAFTATNETVADAEPGTVSPTDTQTDTTAAETSPASTADAAITDPAAEPVLADQTAAEPESPLSPIELAEEPELVEESTEPTVLRADDLNAAQLSDASAHESAVEEDVAAEPVDLAIEEVADEPVPAPVEPEPAPLALPEAVLTEPVRTAMVPPIYPNRCVRRAGDTERITVMFDIDSRGRPLNQRVASSSNSCFDQAALSAIDRWTFQPATRDGVPVPAYGQTADFVFTLPD